MTASACASSGPDAASAREAATEFHRTLAAGDVPAACAVLSPNAVDDVRGPTDQACASALAALPIAPGGAVQSAAVYGRSAIVVLSRDTVFLARFAHGWLVTGAGCQPQGADLPYDCVVDGG